MACVATGYVLYAAHVVLLYQGGAQFGLLGIALPVDRHRVRAARLLVAHVEYLITRAEIVLRSAMASEAPLHLQRFLLIHQRHRVDRAVAGIAADAFGDVNAVIEINEIGKLVDARPLQRLAGTVAGAHRFEQLGIGPDLRVAIHAGLGWRNTGETRGLNRSVAITAIDAESGDVMLMAEWDRLRLAHSGVGHVGGSLNDVKNPPQCRNDKHGAKNGGAGQTIRAAMKDLRHSLM